mgnify:CR=1 FL=1
MIELDDIHKAFNQGQPNEYWALSGINLKAVSYTHLTLPTNREV